jgi:hypothetical protein
MASLRCLRNFLPRFPPEGLPAWSRDGLLSLFEMTRVHLFKEAYWRETGEWLGEEVGHHERPRRKAC